MRRLQAVMINTMFFMLENNNEKIHIIINAKP